MAEQLPVVRSCVFDAGGSVTLEYAFAADVKGCGLVRNHVLYVPAGGDWDLEVDAVMDALQALLVDALDGFDAVPAVRGAQEDDDDEEDDDEDDQL
jgi:hypothetical protein